MGAKNSGLEQCELFWIRTSAAQFEKEPEMYALLVCSMWDGKKTNNMYLHVFAMQKCLFFL